MIRHSKEEAWSRSEGQLPTATPEEEAGFNNYCICSMSGRGGTEPHTRCDGQANIQEYSRQSSKGVSSVELPGLSEPMSLDPSS